MKKKNSETALEIVCQQLQANPLPETTTHRNRMEINSSKGDKVYVVSQRKSDGKWLCGCPDFIFNKRSASPCKHLLAMQAALEEAEEVAQKLIG